MSDEWWAVHASCLTAHAVSTNREIVGDQTNETERNVIGENFSSIIKHPIIPNIEKKIDKFPNESIICFRLNLRSRFSFLFKRKEKLPFTSTSRCGCHHKQRNIILNTSEFWINTPTSEVDILSISLSLSLFLCLSFPRSPFSSSSHFVFTHFDDDSEFEMKWMFWLLSHWHQNGNVWKRRKKKKSGTDRAKPSMKQTREKEQKMVLILIFSTMLKRISLTVQ